MTVLYFMLGIVVAVLVAVLIQRKLGFIAQTANDYIDAGPAFDMRKHLSGPMVCDGVIYGPTGRVTSSFNASFDVEWNGDNCLIREEFRYSNGSTQSRLWQISLDAEDRFIARADDIQGEAYGELSGPTVLFRYKLVLPPESGGHVLSAFDCMYATADGVVVNRSQFRKFGIKVAELVATIRKVDIAEPMARAG